jgi:hypothetical protein
MAGKKRSTNLKAKEKRARSWTRNQEAKKLRIAEQKKREEHNKKVGSTGKQRANEAAKVAKRLDSALKGNVTDLGDFSQYAEQEDLLET